MGDRVVEEAREAEPEPLPVAGSVRVGQLVEVPEPPPAVVAEAQPEEERLAEAVAQPVAVVPEEAVAGEEAEAVEVALTLMVGEPAREGV